MTIFFKMKNIEDSRSIPSETSWPGTTTSDNHKKNSLLPSAVKFIEWNTEAAIFSNEGCLGPKSIVR